MFGTWRCDSSLGNDVLTQQPVDPATARPLVQQACQSCREKKVPTLATFLRAGPILLTILDSMFGRKRWMHPVQDAVQAVCLHTKGGEQEIKKKKKRGPAGSKASCLKGAVQSLLERWLAFKASFKRYTAGGSRSQGCHLGPPR